MNSIRIVPCGMRCLEGKKNSRGPYERVVASKRQGEVALADGIVDSLSDFLIDPRAVDTHQKPRQVRSILGRLEENECPVPAGRSLAHTSRGRLRTPIGGSWFSSIGSKRWCSSKSTSHPTDRISSSKPASMIRRGPSSTPWTQGQGAHGQTDVRTTIPSLAGDLDLCVVCNKKIAYCSWLPSLSFHDSSSIRRLSRDQLRQ